MPEILVKIPGHQTLELSVNDAETSGEIIDGLLETGHLAPLPQGYIMSAISYDPEKKGLSDTGAQGLRIEAVPLLQWPRDTRFSDLGVDETFRFSIMPKPIT